MILVEHGPKGQAALFAGALGTVIARDAPDVAQALAETGARGLDVSSGVESAPGVKDLERMEQFFAAVRQATAKGPVSGSVQ